MEQTLSTLLGCQFFKNISEETLQQLLNKPSIIIRNYQKNEYIANAEDPCNSLGIVIEGTINIQKSYPAGKTITVDILGKSDVFGEALIFSSNGIYPSSLLTVTNCKVLFIPKDEIIKLCLNDEKYLRNFLGTLSDKVIMLNRKLKNLSYQTIRQKVVSYLLEEYQKQSKIIIDLPFSRANMAEYLDIPRPSLSRELIRLKEEGLIDFYKNSIKIICLDKLESCLF